MKIRYFKIGIILLAGFLGGIAFVISCGTGPSGSSAQPSCGTYQVRSVVIYDMMYNNTTLDVPAGWTPIAVGGTGSTNDFLIITKCK
jgi:hypothetical protein